MIHLNIALILGLIALFIFLAVVSYLQMNSPQAIAIQQEQEKVIQQKNDAKELQRLMRKHGYPDTVIYEPGQVPYYYNARGRKCKLM
jgi:hypothetical protein